MTKLTREEILSLPAGRKADGTVLKYVFDIEPTETGWVWFNGEYIEIPRFTTDIAAAWEVVEWLQRKGWSFEFTEHADPEGDYIMQVWRRDSMIKDFISRATSAPLAICRAALLAVMDD